MHAHLTVDSPGWADY